MMKRLLLQKTCAVVLLVLSSAPWAQGSVTLNSASFPDDNFRAALSAITGVSEGSSFNEATLTELDVSNKGITNIKGVELLTALTKLIASHNDIQFANITNNPHLEWLDLSDNPALRGFNSTSGSGSNSAHWITLTNNMPLKHLDLSNCNIGYFQALSTGYHVNSLTWLSLANNPAMAGWSPGISNQTDLVYCDLTNTAQTSASVAFSSAHNKLETLILKNNSNFGYSSSFQYLSALKYLDISGCDLYFRNGTSSAYYLLHYLTPTNNPNLETLIASNSKMGEYTEGLTGFSKLKTVDVSGNPGVTQFWINGSPLLESLDVTGLNQMSYLQLNEDALPRSGFTFTGGSTCTALRSLYLNDNNYNSVGQATTDFASISSLAYLYLESNDGFTGNPLTVNASDCGNLTGIDLNNNGFTSFSAPSLPATLTALMLGENSSMTRLEMHNNPGITKMTSSDVMTDGCGLYLLGNSALTYMDISGTADQPNHFVHIGNNSSLDDVPIDTLKASYNKFYTFRNLSPVEGGFYETCSKSNYAYGRQYALTPRPDYDYYYSSWWPANNGYPDSASLEQLTGLRYLDLSHCQLKDSLYLHSNVNLEYLDVSHNRTIDYRTTSGDKGAAYRASNNGSDKTVAAYTEFPDYKKYLWLASPESSDQEPYTHDYNDTTGLYILDLMHNDKLVYLDISYTGIEQTAATHCHVANARYIWIQDLPLLKYFYADYNGMRSLGTSTKRGKFHQEGLASLERLSVIGMRGADNRTMMGSINPHGIVSPNLHYVNLAYSDYDSIGVWRIPQLDTLIIRGNPIHYLNVQSNPNIVYVDARECAFKMRGYDPSTGNTYPPDANIFKNGARIGGEYSSDMTNEVAANPTVKGDVTTPFSGLRAVRAYDRPYLHTLLLDNNNALREVYCFKNPVLPKIHGFESLPFPKPAVDQQYGYPAVDVDSLDLVWVNDNASFIELNLTNNANLRYLHAYNDKALGTALAGNGMDLTANHKLVSAWVSNSLLEKFQNGAGANLDTLRIWQNPVLEEINVTANTGLKVLDFRNCMVRNINLDNNHELTYFDCCNLDSAWIGQDPTYQRFQYDYDMPRRVPTIVDDPGKNSIADLHFASNVLEEVHADANDLYRMDGLANNPNLHTLTYSYNHINAIDLSGCPNINPNKYNCEHNVRGLIMSELSEWSTTVNQVTTVHKMYYLQLEPDAGDALEENYDTYLGHKAGQDSLLSSQDNGYLRRFVDDGFDPDKVLSFKVNSSGVYDGTRGEETPAGAPKRVVEIIDPSVEVDLSTIYGKIAVIKLLNEERNYVTYMYDDQRPSTNRDSGGSEFGIAWAPPGHPTHVMETTADGLSQLTIVSERYYDTAGAEHSEPIQGVNIIVRQMSDGSTQTVKVVK